MTVYYKLTDRKLLVKALEEITGAKSSYLGMPSCSYQVDFYTVTREGNLFFDDMADSEMVEAMLEELEHRGFTFESQEYDVPMPDITMEEPLEDCPPAYDTPTTAAEVERFTIQMPMMDEASVANLKAIVEAKGNLIRQSFGTDSLPIEEVDGRLSFPWFAADGTKEAIHAYMNFISKLCAFATVAKRVNAKEKESSNPRYDFRCFLLRLGFIGDEYKADRKVLLRNLTGSSAFKSGAKRKYAPGLDPIPTPENTVIVNVPEALARLKDPQVQNEIRAILNGEACE